MQKTWRIRQADPEVVARLRTDVIDRPEVAQLMALRGLTDFDSAKAFFRPSLDQLHDPMLMLDMPKAVDRVVRALHNKERILVYGDYDVDGTTSVALVYSYLVDKAEVSYYIPDRHTEGYGISKQGMQFAADNGFALVIALDCGIRGNESIAFGNTLGLDVIVCDHHLPGPELPAAYALLDQKRADCHYPYKELCGCGVGFKLVQALEQVEGRGLERIEHLLDLVAIAIGSDIVPITGENRVLAHFGLQRINQSPSIAINALLENIKVKKEFTVSDVVFMIGPRINAAGRISTGNKAVELLISTDQKLAQEVAKEIGELNKHRREHDASVTESALQIISNDPFYTDSCSTVVYSEDWHKGVVGIVASRLIETYYRPTIVLTRSDEYAVGSARSVHGYDVHEAIAACADLLEQYGGHKYAAGLKLRIDRVHAFRERFEQVVAQTITADQQIPGIDIDLELNLSAIDQKFMAQLKRFAPFGPGNLNPTFATRGLIALDVRTVGSDMLHLKLQVAHPDHPNTYFDAIGWNMAQHIELVKARKPFDMAYAIEENEYRGVRTIQLNVKDIRGC